MNDMKRRVLRRVSLITTVYNERRDIGDFLESVASQSCYPGEVVIVDGNSTDGTAEVIRHFAREYNGTLNVVLIVDASCNRAASRGPIARGRNVAIRRSRGEIIAATDGGCVLEPQWLEEISHPLLMNHAVDVVGGWYTPDARNFLEQCIGNTIVMPSRAIRAESFIPSSRSIAFRKQAWRAVGGYPEESYTSEDTAFVRRLRMAGFRFALASNALVAWRMPSSLAAVARQYFRYGRGDGETGAAPYRIVLTGAKVGFPLCCLYLGLLWNPWTAILALIYWVLLPFNHRWSELLRLRTLPRIPVMATIKTLIDSAYLAGSISGRIASIGHAERSMPGTASQRSVQRRR